MQGIFQKENTDKALKYGIYRHLPTYEKIIRNLVSFYIIKKYKYVRINYHRKVDKNSIRRIVVNEEDIDLNNMIIFDETVEWVYYSNAYEDQELLLILLAKTIELGWNQFSRYSQTSMKVIKEFLSANNK